MLWQKKKKNALRAYVKKISCYNVWAFVITVVLKSTELFCFFLSTAWSLYNQENDCGGKKNQIPWELKQPAVFGLDFRKF